jgi:integrase
MPHRAAWTASTEWGLYVWLSAVTGARRGEVIASQWDDVDLVSGVLRLDENYVRTADGDAQQGHEDPPDAAGVDRRAAGALPPIPAAALLGR